jgi:hypothetical protein
MSKSPQAFGFAVSPAGVGMLARTMFANEVFSGHPGVPTTREVWVVSTP